MSEGSFLGDLRSVLDIALQNGGCQQHKDWVILSALSKVQRSLQSSTLKLLSNENFGFEAQDCALLKDVGRPCMKEDLEGLSSNLVFLLASESSFVNHSAGKTFMVLLDYLDEMPHLWIFTMHILWSDLKTWLSNCEDFYTKQKCTSEDATTQCPSTKQGHLTRHKGWTVVMCVFQVLHHILRKCKQEGASKLRTFLTISGPFITEVLAAFITCFPRMDNNTVKHKHEEEDLALGTLLRFLCSVNHSMSVHSDAIDTANISAKCLILESVDAFAATFSHHCLNAHNDSCVSHYLRHKFLMLLFRLHKWFIAKPSLAITCSDILKSHLDSLCGSLFQRHTQLTGPSLRSPFAPCLVQRKTTQASSSSTCQPERLAVFLIFKVFASLRKVSSGSSMGSEFPGSNISSAEQQSATQREQSLFNWLLLQINLIGDVSSLDTVEVADCLASSFLQIFVDEDTLMLEMLLLLLDTFTFQFYPGYADADHESLQVAHKVMVAIFKPLRLFVVFLSMVCYDHLVILEFLISKDTSISCLQYLLRCLRIVSNTWPELLSLSRTCYDMHSRKDAISESKMGEELQAESAAHGDPSNVKEKNMLRLVCDTVIDIDKVANCLLSLKHSVEQLHGKHVFPYNPSPLLKHLDSFQHLWLL